MPGVVEKIENVQLQLITNLGEKNLVFSDILCSEENKSTIEFTKDGTNKHVDVCIRFKCKEIELK